MVDKKTSQETLSGAIADADYFRGVQGGNTIRFLFSAVKVWIKSWIAKADVGLGNVDNTSDALKPLSNAMGIPYTVGDVLTASGVGTLTRLADVAAGQPFVSGGVAAAPAYAGSWAKFDTAGKLFSLNRNAASDAVANTSTALLVDQIDASNGFVEVRSFGGSAVISGFLGSKSGGSLGARTTVQAADKLTQFLAAGWNGGTNTYDVVGALSFSAIDTFSAGVSGTGSKMALITPGTSNELIVTQWFGSGKIALGAGNLTNPQGTVVVSNNVAAGVVSAAGTPVLQVVGVDGVSASVDVAAFASPAGLNLGRANTSAAARSAVASGDNMGVIFGAGWDGANYIQSAGFRFNANQTFSVGANGTSIIVLTTANGSLVLGECARFWGSKGISVGTATDPGTSGSIIASGFIESSSPSAGVGYAAGAGGTVAQGGTKATGVTLNKTSGAVTMNNALLAAGGVVSFVVTNSAVGVADVPVVAVQGGGTANAYRADVTAVAAGSFTVTVQNLSGGGLSESPVISFVLIKGQVA